MATRSIGITKGLDSIRIDDFDLDNEVRIKLTEEPCQCSQIFLKLEDLISLKKHIDYLVNKGRFTKPTDK